MDTLVREVGLGRKKLLWMWDRLCKNVTQMKSPAYKSCVLVAYRLVNWFPDMPADVRWMQEQLFQIAATVYAQAKNKLFCTAR